MPFDAHFIVPSSIGDRCLLLPDGDGWRLPHWPLADAPPEREPGFAVAVRAWVRERLGVDSVVLHWWNVEASTEGEPTRQTVYVLENRGATAPIPPGRWVGREEIAALTLTRPHHRPVIEAWLDEAGDGRAPPERQPWQRVGWFDGAARWIEEQLRGRGTPVVEPPRQWHTKGGCCLLRARTAARGVYFKALPAMYAREPVLTRRLAALQPGRVAEVLASTSGATGS